MLMLAETCSVVVTFFGTVQEVFVFFSGSTHRWEKLQKHVSVCVNQVHGSVKPDGVRTSAQAARQDAVYAIDSQLDGLIDALEELRADPDENTKTCGDAGNNFAKYSQLAVLSSAAILGQFSPIC